MTICLSIYVFRYFPFSFEGRIWDLIVSFPDHCLSFYVIDFKNGVLHANIIRVIERVYDKAQSAVLFNESTGDWFRTTVVDRQECLLSPTLFNIFLERIVCETLDGQEGSVSIGGRLITNFPFADDVVINAEEEDEAGVSIQPLKGTKKRLVQTRRN